MSEVAYLRSYTAEQLGFGFPEKNRPGKTEKIRPPVTTMSTNELTETLKDTLHRAFDGTDAPIERVAQKAGSNKRAAKGWWEGDNCPSAHSLLNLMATVPEFGAEVLRLTGLHAGIDPEFEREMHALWRTFNQAMDRKRGGER
jgi:hypothetical protein